PCPRSRTKVVRQPMVLAKERPKREARTRGPRSDAARARDTDPGPTRADALRRIAAKVSGRRDVAGLFDDVIDEAFALFGVDRAGLWLYDPNAPEPLKVAAHRGLSVEIIEAIDAMPPDAATMGMDALRRREVRVLDRAMRATTPRLRALYRGIGIRRVCFVPLVFGDESLG